MISTQKSKKPAKKIAKGRFIEIKGARSNNLKNIDVLLPKDKLIVVTGLSGSGKSSLIMDTLFAEGQRRYVESLSSYARQFLNRMKKPEVDYIRGICPAIAIEQRVTSGNNRSTVGSMTEIYDYIRLLYGRVGRIFSPITGKEVKRDSVSDVMDYLRTMPADIRVYVLCPIVARDDGRSIGKELDALIQKGYTRIKINGEILRMEDWMESNPKKVGKKISSFDKAGLHLLVDRFVSNLDDQEMAYRASDSVQTAFVEGHGECIIETEKGEIREFNNRLEQDGIEFKKPDPKLFNFNTPFGACPKCEGYGKILGISPDKVIPNANLSVFDKAVACWRSEKASKSLDKFLAKAHLIDFPIHTPYRDLTQEQKDQLWYGTKQIAGIYKYFSQLESKTYKIQNRVLLARYRGRTNCTECSGSRLRKEALYIQVGNKNIAEIITWPIDQLTDHFDHLQLNEYDLKVASRILLELKARLHTMLQVGLPYLTLDRISNTLSGGESQRIHLTRLLSSNLTASLYILDEPSIGLHPRDTARLVAVLKSLKDLHNTVVVVEHEETVIRAADHIIDMGPKAGIHGGDLVYSGPLKAGLRLDKGASLTMDYLNGYKKIELPAHRRKPVNNISLTGASLFNLKKVNVEIPLHAISVVTGVSGSGKTTLVKRILYPALRKCLEGQYTADSSDYEDLGGDLHLITEVEFINQNPIGKSSRSNPVTYIKAYDAIRKLMSSQRLSILRGYKPKEFSFNVEGGRCETCKGEGEIKVEMQFLADVQLECEECKGKRFQASILEVTHNDKNIADILEMSVEEALEFFKEEKEIYRKIKPLDDVGLGYVKLGQSSNTLSGGEAQRVKLSSYLGMTSKSDHIVFIFDEPTTGLHFDDIRRLLYAFNALVEKGHTVIIVEHNMEVIKSADWVIDLGPEGGLEGGQLLYQGTPEGLAKVKTSYTGQYLKNHLGSITK